MHKFQKLKLAEVIIHISIADTPFTISHTRWLIILLLRLLS